MNSNDGSLSCDLARASIADGVVVRAPYSPDLDAHLTTCAACRAYRDECEALWTALGELPEARPAPGARARFDRALARDRGSRRPRWVTAVTAISVAAGLVIAAAAGYGLGSANHTPARVATTIAAAPGPEFLLLLYDTEASSLNRSPQQITAIIAEYSAWARGLRTAGNLVSAEKLTDDAGQSYGAVLSSTAGAERLGGFFLIRARDLAEAQRIAEGCPHVKHGGRVELRAIQPT